VLFVWVQKRMTPFTVQFSRLPMRGQAGAKRMTPINSPELNHPSDVPLLSPPLSLDS